jgi:hypothetical protein
LVTDLSLEIWWEPRDPSQADDARRLSRFVTGLPDFDPIYRSWLKAPTSREDWLKSPASREKTIRVPLSEAEAKQLLIDNKARYNFPNWPQSEHGSTIGGAHAGPSPYDLRESSFADTHCHIGAFGQFAPILNHIFMRLSNLRSTIGRPWRASELRPLMKFARDVWKPTEMGVVFSFYKAPMIPDPAWAGGKRFLRPVIGWITYLPPDLASRAKYPADVEVESFEDGAVLVTLCEEPFEKDAAEGMARLHALEAALRPIQT